MSSDRKNRWTDTTPEQRSAAMTEVAAAHRRAALDRQIDRLADSAAVLTDEQRAKLARLLDSPMTKKNALALTDAISQHYDTGPDEPESGAV
jgi:hypothetical protein